MCEWPKSTVTAERVVTRASARTVGASGGSGVASSPSRGTTTIQLGGPEPQVCTELPPRTGSHGENPKVPACTGELGIRTCPHGGQCPGRDAPSKIDEVPLGWSGRPGKTANWLPTSIMTGTARCGGTGSPTCRDNTSWCGTPNRAWTVRLPSHGHRRGGGRTRVVHPVNESGSGISHPPLVVRSNSKIHSGP